MKILEKMKKYFDAKVIGSYLLVEMGLLLEEEINDIDVMVPSIKKARSFLIDEEWIETEAPHPRKGYDEFEVSMVFKSLFYDTPIHIVQGHHEVWDYKTLLSKKILRGEKSDLQQIEKVCSRILNNQK